MGLLDILGSVAGGAILNRITGDWQNEQQEKMAKQQFNYQKELQNDAYRLGNMYWKQQFDYQNNYNLPANQVQRLMAAGINPFVDSSTASPISSNAEGSSVAGGTPSVPMPQAASYSGVAGSALSLVQAAKEAKGMPLIQAKLQAEIDNLLSQVRDNNAKAEVNSITARIQREFGKDTARATLKVLQKRLPEIESIIQRNDNEGFKLWKDGLLSDARRVLTAKEANNFENLMSHLFAMYESQVNLNKASAQNQRAQSSLAGSERTRLDLENGLTAALYDKKIEQFDAALDKLKNEGQLTSQQVEIGRAAVARAQLEEDNATLLFWQQFLSSVLHDGIDVTEAVTSFKNLGAYKSLSKSKQREVDLAVDKFNRDILEKSKGKHVQRSYRTTTGRVIESYYENK